MSTTFVDFQELKQKISIHQCLTMLGVTLKVGGEQMRGPCPACKTGGDRALVVTPSKNIFYCFAAKKGGDQIALVSHIRGLGAKEAANAIAEHYGTNILPVPRNGTVPSNGTSSRGTVPQGQEAKERPPEALKPLDYLLAEHEAVQALGLASEACGAFGAGYAPKGIMRGRVAIPIHDPTGQKLLAYVGRAVGNEEPKLLFPKNYDPQTTLFNAHRVAHGDFVYLALDPLDVLKAHQNGVENVVACLGTLNANFLQALSIWMDEKDIQFVEPM
jgi:DNA primase